MKAKAFPLVLKTNLSQIFFQNFSRIFKSVSITSFQTLHPAFIWLLKSSVLYLCQRVFKNRYKIDTNRVSIANWGKIIKNRGSSSCCKSGQFQLFQIGPKLLQIRAIITNWDRIITNRGRYYKLGQLLQISAGHKVSHYFDALDLLLNICWKL